MCKLSDKENHCPTILISGLETRRNSGLLSDLQSPFTVHVQKTCTLYVLNQSYFLMSFLLTLLKNENCSIISRRGGI